MGIIKNQAATCHPLFFDPLNMKTSFTVDEEGKRKMSYVRDRVGVTVYDNGEVEFCYYAPGAKSVQVAGISGSMSRDRIDLEDEGNGFFSKKVAAGTIAPGFHYHNWFIDGNPVRNPRAQFTYGCFEPFNFFEIPEREDDFYLLKDVPHGEIRQELYTSGVNGHVKACYVYTPPCYNKEPDKSYPVLYIQHGVGENETGWIWSGKLNFILDNLLAEGKCREMIVVMCSGYAFKPGEDPVFYPGDFDAELTRDCIPFIESKYRVKPGKENRAMAGLSLGSAQATLTVSKHRDMFSSLGVFSGAAVKEMDRILSDDEEPLKLVFLSGGNGEGGLVQLQEKYKEKFAAKGMNCIVKGYPGFHEWHVWRKAFRDYAQNLFTWVNDTGKASEAVTRKKPYTQLNVSEEQLIKQTVEMQPLFFDPVYKNVIFATDEEGRPAGRYKDMKPGVVIKDQGVVEINFLAPAAESVEVKLLGEEKVALQKAPGKDGEDGYWTCILKNVRPGFHYHEYYLNGIEVINPWAPLCYGCFKPVNFFEMPEPGFDLHQLKNVPHGSIRMNYYKSSQTGRIKLCYVYTPAGYEKNPDKSYPVLYLQHGGGENETAWIWQGKIGNIMDNLIAEKKCEQMLVVMNTGYSFREDGSSNPLLGSVAEEIAQDCIPFIDSHYRTKKDRLYRAMAGTSMGGMQTQRTVLAYPDLFAWAGILSGGLTIKGPDADYSDILLNREKFNEYFRMLFVACGKQDSGIYKFTMEGIEELSKHGITPEMYFTDGYHDWTFWRHSIAEFIKKLFR